MGASGEWNYLHSAARRVYFLCVKVSVGTTGVTL